MHFRSVLSKFLGLKERRDYYLVVNGGGCNPKEQEATQYSTQVAELQWHEQPCEMTRNLGLTHLESNIEIFWKGIHFSTPPVSRTCIKQYVYSVGGGGAGRRAFSPATVFQ
jgi:hypothetical protein